jgi:hypothetical protein
MQRISGELERTWRVLVMQEGASKREIWKHKVEQVIEETDSLKLAIDRVHKRVRVPSNFGCSTPLPCDARWTERHSVDRRQADGAGPTARRKTGGRQTSAIGPN